MIWLLGCGLAIAHAATDLNQALQAHGLTMKNGGKWSVEKSTTVQSGERKIQTLTAQSDGVTLELTFLNTLKPAQSAAEADLEYTSIVSAYKAALTPYSGAVSKRLSCGPKFSPRNTQSRVAGRKVRTVVGFASERKTFGACSDGEAAYEFAFAAVSLPGDSLLKLTAFRKRGGQLDPRFWSRVLGGLTLENHHE